VTSFGFSAHVTLRDNGVWMSENSLLESNTEKFWTSLRKLIEPIASFHEIQKITKMSFNIPLK
jgi:hypothetical protein